MTPIERFLSKVCVLPTGCHSWTAGHDRDGYAMFWFAGRNWRASRFIYEAVHGPLYEAQACHTCDTPGCVNVEHLFGGSQKENIADAIAKGRFTQHLMAKDGNAGEKNGNHKLTVGQVREIRERYRPGQAPHASPTSLRALAAEYGVSKYAITYALKGWKHLTSATQ